MELPQTIAESRLHGRLAEDHELLDVVLSLRAVAGSLAETVSRTIPSFTDHTIRHMDALWTVLDHIVVKEEMLHLTTAEAFLLACGFYLHDIGMAYAATAVGLERIQSSPPYMAFMQGIPDSIRSGLNKQARGVAYAVRTLHADAAMELATTPVPGTDMYLFESQSIRHAWAETCGRIAASHHWSLESVERELGSAGAVPLPGGRNGDLAYVASLLRLTDYAHINRDRAPKIDRSFRQGIEADNLVHWLAQEHVDGPKRDGADLVYRAAVPIADVDAWWLYYEMLKGLDNEIRSVRRYLDRRSESHGRLSLQGVRGATTPEEAAVFIPTQDFLPIEINLRTGSMEKLVRLLAGESLYGPDPMASVRELIQNARDAVLLKRAVAKTDYDRASLSIPIRLALKSTGPKPRLEVTDPGVGMTRKVMTDFLISIASDYWASQFHTDFPSARDHGFEPAGKFGIGFLSVFMLGDQVTVESNRDGGERCRLHLRGVGRRGEMRTASPPSGSGTAVRIELRDTVIDALRELDKSVRVYAPMVAHGIEVEVDGRVTNIPAGWLESLDDDTFFRWTLEAIELLTRTQRTQDADFLYRRTLHGRSRYNWRDEMVTNWSEGWPQFREQRVRLLAAFEGYSLLCLTGHCSSSHSDARIRRSD